MTPVIIRSLLLGMLCTCLCSWTVDGQTLFPVKKDQRWGLIDARGHMQVSPKYDAIGDFERFGYATMQQQGRVGLLNRRGKEIIPARYQDLRVIDSLLVAVLDHEEWQVRNLAGKVILQPGYEHLEVWQGPYLGYSRNQKWGVITKEGKEILPPNYDQIMYAATDSCFYLYEGEQMGIASLTGSVLLSPGPDRIKRLLGRGYLIKEKNRWGLLDANGQIILPAEYLTYDQVSPYYLKMYRLNQVSVYSWLCGQVIASDRFQDIIPLSPRYLITRENDQVGLIDWCGQRVLTSQYQEIQGFTEASFRVRTSKGDWQIVGRGDVVLSSTSYQYIAPPKGPAALVRQADGYGLINVHGEEIVPAVYQQLVWDGQKVRAFRQKSAEEGATGEVIYVDASGQPLGEQRLQQHFTVKVAGVETGPAANPNGARPGSQWVAGAYEWFYQSGEDRWGMRHIATGEIQLSPAFKQVKPIPETGLTLVSLPGKTPMEFERTSFRFDQVFGLVNHELGALVTDLQFLDIRFADFSEGNPLARCLFTDGTSGLINRSGRVVSRGYTYIGPFRNGRARASQNGALTASMEATDGLMDLRNFLDEVLAPSVMTDYTQYDRIFQRTAEVICADCSWGYLNEQGGWAIKPTFSFVQDMVNEVGIVRKEQKWGAVHANGRSLIPCEYDQLHFLENTDNQILRVYVEKPKYGLIDTFGQLAIRATYDNIGALSESRLAVMHNGLWGFTNLEGQEIISCRFDEVQPFSEGLAAVRLDNQWGFVDRMGQVVIDFQYKAVGAFADGVAWVQTDNGVGYIDSGGLEQIASSYEKASDFYRGVARVRVDGSWGLIDRNGQFLVHPKFNAIQPFHPEAAVAIVRYGRLGEKYGLIRLDGTMLTRTPYHLIEPFSEGLAVVKDKDKYGYIDLAGNMVIPARYSQAEPFSEGRAAVYLNGDCGYIDREGNKRSEFTFSRCNPFADGRAVVYRGLKRAGLLDTNGELVLTPSVDRMLTFSEGRGLVRDGQYRFYFITEQADIHHGFYEKASEFAHGVAVVRLNNKWGVINRKGIALIPPKYSQISSFDDGYARVRVEGFSGLTTARGERIVSPDFEFISYAGEGVFRVEQGDKVGYFDEEGTWIWDLED